MVPGLEEVLAAELVRLGFAPEIDHGGVEVRTDLQGVLTLGVQLRTGNRVVVRVATVGAASLDQLAERVRKLPWKRWVWPGQPIEVKATCSQSRLRVASNVARKVELAVRDSLKGPRLPGPRPPREPLGVQVRVVDDRATISVDASGELLHLRGWRRDAVAAPLRETLAAALLDLAGWRPDVPLVDPMCGSGTFAIEAARFAAGIPAGGSRSHAAERFPAVTAAMVKAARARGPRPAGPRAPILAADRDEAAIAATRANARRAGVSDRIEVVRCPFSELEAPPTPGLVVANPPYGKRLRSDPAEVYRKLGRTLRDDWRGWRVGVLVPSGRASWLGLPGDVRATFSNGGIRVDWVVVPPLG